MIRKVFVECVALVFLVTLSCVRDDRKDPMPALQLSGVTIGTYILNLTAPASNTAAPSDKPIVAAFSSVLDQGSVTRSVTLTASSGEVVPIVFSFMNNAKTISMAPQPSLKANEKYTLTFSDELTGAQGETFVGFSTQFTTLPASLEIISYSIGGKDALSPERVTEVSIAQPTIEIEFSTALEVSTVTEQTIRISDNGVPVARTLSFANENKKIVLTPSPTLKDLNRYQILISNQIKGIDQETLQQQATLFYTAPDPAPDFPVISDDALLTLTQQQTFKYFWDFAHPVSGLARERNTSGDLVTSGGSGFGIMAIIVGIERNFITRSDGVARLKKIVTFLETADRFHGAWSHWLNGVTGDVIPFSPNDNGGDLVETSFLVQGLLTFRQYLQPSDTTGNNLINRITKLYNTVDWNWYTQNNQPVLYWHWSPDKAWTMNHRIQGYNEALITYFLAAASTTSTIDKMTYDAGWARNGNMKNGKSFYDFVLPLGPDYGGPLFFAHYSFLGLDPRTLQDGYANYALQNKNHTLINQAYCIDNPRNFVGYSDSCWGLTASDNQNGYSAHSPTNDLGVISPTAALSSFPYTPGESMKALKFFYYTVGDRLWGEYGFHDAFNLTEGWTADSYLAIDQGPIIIMIENHRTGLLWNLFMSAPEVTTAKTKLGFD